MNEQADPSVEEERPEFESDEEAADGGEADGEGEEAPAAS